MNAFDHRTWIPFYLISFGTLSMAIYRSMDGVMLLGSLVLVSAAVGVIFLTIQAEVERSTEKKELMETLQKKILTAGETTDREAK
jgi:hypothetical protein